MKLINSTAVIFIVAMLSFCGFYEVYVRPGWVDSGMYIGYAINPVIYKTFAFAAHNYQGSRLGYILPMQLMVTLFGNESGRIVYVCALYVIYLFSIFSITKFFIKETIEKVLLNIFFVFNPCFVSGIFYGGADGPAAVQLVLAISLLLFATRISALFRRNLILFISGFFLVLSISSHIFSVVTAVLIIPILVYLYGRKNFAVWLTLGGSFCMFICNYFGYQLGLDQFYLLYSLPWAKVSMFGGVGAKLAEPFFVNVEKFFVWYPLLFAIAFFVLINRSRIFRKNNFTTYMAGSLVMMVGPIVTFTFYDFATGGNTLVTPAYFNIIYPSFIVGLTLMVSLTGEAAKEESLSRILRYRNRTRGALISLVAVSLVVACTSEHLKSVFTYNNVRSHDLYCAEVSFVERMTSLGLDTNKFKLVFKAVGPEAEQSVRVYKDYHKGKKRYQDYLDSLAALFLWDRSIALRLTHNADLSKSILHTTKNDVPFVFLGRDKKEVQELIGTFQKFLDGYVSDNYECFSNEAYPWCFVSFRYFK